MPDTSIKDLPAPLFNRHAANILSKVMHEVVDDGLSIIRLGSAESASIRRAIRVLNGVRHPFLGKSVGP